MSGFRWEVSRFNLETSPSLVCECCDLRWIVSFKKMGALTTRAAVVPSAKVPPRPLVTVATGRLFAELNGGMAL